MARSDTTVGMRHVRADTPDAPDLRGRWLVLAQAAWLLVTLLTVAVFVTAIPARLEQLQGLSTVTQEEGRVARLVSMQLAPKDLQGLSDLGLSMRAYALYHVTIEVVFALVCTAVGVLLVWRRSDEWMALLVALSFIAAAAAVPPTIQALVAARPAWRMLGHAVQAAYIGTNVVIYLFPDGRFVPRWTRWPAIILVLWSLAWVVYPPVQPATWPLVPALLATLVMVGSLGFSQVYRYARVSNPLQRQQTKWFVLGLSLGLVAIIVYDFNLIGLLFPPLNEPGAGRIIFNFTSRPIYYGLRTLPVVAITIAILRYRLWDIDHLINRTLVYGTISVVLTAVYAGSVVLLQLLFGPLLGGGNSLAVVASTLAIAALFQPLRRRTQETIDRRFYHHKYDAAKTLQEFSANLRDEVDVHRLSQEMVDVVQEALQPAHVSLWLRPVEGAATRQERTPG